MGPGPASGGRERPAKGRRRSAGRRQAVEILYQADITERSGEDVAREWQGTGRSVDPYAAELVAGVDGSRSRIDTLLEQVSQGWTVPRMAPVDRTILRIACYELQRGVPPGVAINEAVGLAKELSTGESGRFVNGVLGEIARGGASRSECEP